jgi:hypothetical protein
MEARKVVDLCANNSQGTRSIDCHDANQNLILQFVAFRQPTEYESQTCWDHTPNHSSAHFPLWKSLLPSQKQIPERFLSCFSLTQTITVRLTMIKQDKGLAKSNASLCFLHLWYMRELIIPNKMKHPIQILIYI